MARRISWVFGFLLCALPGAMAEEQARTPENLPQGTIRSSADRLLAGVKAPPGWRVTLFAAPPDVAYPTCLATSPNGEVFVGIDENGSLDAKPKRGRVVRCVDKDGDGKADVFSVFAEMDSPRGLVFDPATNTLYVQHPPDVTAYQDTNGDGVSDRSEDVVKGIGFDLKFRGADHTTNGIRLAIDGFLYIAVGDYGFMKAQGKDGAAVQLRGGGIARVRPDGTGLEVYSRGQRNIYDVAIDNYLNIFTRDNTNDGGGWDVRLSHVIPTAQMGYPSLFTNFGDEIVPPLADYGGGSPCGSLYLDEPGFPAGFGNTLYTCDWGRGIVYRHPLKPKGAGFIAEQVEFADIPRPTDMDVDGRGRLYISSWREGGFTYSGPNVGFVARVTPPGPKRPAPADPKTLKPEGLIALLRSDSASMRLAAQREWVRRVKAGDRPRASLLIDLATGQWPLPARVAALYTLAQSDPDRAGLLVNTLLVGKPGDMLEFALRCAGDYPRLSGDVPTASLIQALDHPNPRVRLQAAVQSARLRRADTHPRLVKATADPDPLVSHAAINALISLKAADACLAALDPARPAIAMGAARALQAMHESKVVDGLLERFGSTKDDTLKRAILKALCRLDHKEAPWDGSWWGTRPDTSGPYYKGERWDQSEKIEQALRSGLGSAASPTSRWLLGELMRNKVELEGTTALAIKAAGDDPAFRASVVGLIAGRPNPSAEAVAFLGSVASSPKDSPEVRARAIRGLLRSIDKPGARDAAVHALAPIARLQNPAPDLLESYHEFIRDGRQGRNLAHYATLAEGSDDDQGTLAYAVLLRAEESPRRQNGGKPPALDALDRAMQNPALKARMIRAAGLGLIKGKTSLIRESLADKAPAIRQAAVDAAARLGIRLPGGGPQGPTVALLGFEKARDGVLKSKGDPDLGAQLFQRVGCVNCHTVSKSESLKGPYLGDIANRYSRAELAESILKPSAKIAQGFETQKFATTNGHVLEGFVVRESGTEVEVRNLNGVATVIPKADIEERGKVEQSVMPANIVEPLTVDEVASILAYLERLKAAGP